MGVSNTGRSEAAVNSTKTAIAIDRSEPDLVQAVITRQSERTMLSDCYLSLCVGRPLIDTGRITQLAITS
jgi:hypothetical protein